MKTIFCSAIIFTLCYSSFGQKDGDYGDLRKALQNPDNVKSLTLRERGYRKVPKKISKFKNLEYLDLSMNKIKSLPKWLGDIDSLKHLGIWHSPLKNIDNIIYYTQLEDLSLSFNRIENIPEGVGDLVKLRELHLNGNYITDAPLSICNLKNLQYLGIYDRERDCMIPLEKQEQLKQCLPNCAMKLKNDENKELHEMLKLKRMLLHLPSNKGFPN